MFEIRGVFLIVDIIRVKFKRFNINGEKQRDD